MWYWTCEKPWFSDWGDTVQLTGLTKPSINNHNNSPPLPSTPNCFISLCDLLLVLHLHNSLVIPIPFSEIIVSPLKLKAHWKQITESVSRNNDNYTTTLVLVIFDFGRFSREILPRYIYSVQDKKWKTNICFVFFCFVFAFSPSLTLFKLGPSNCACKYLTAML